MRTTRPRKLVEKSEAAMISAIEIFNKPNFEYREETFALLAVNAWELLLKAKLANEKDNNMRVLFEYEQRNNKDGTKSKNHYIKRNKTGNAQTIGLWKTITTLENDTSIRLNSAVKKNLNALVEIRDNATHFINPGPDLSKQVLEFGTAALRNYITLAKRWFACDFSKYHLFLMPIGFMGESPDVTAISISKTEKNVVQFLTELAKGSRSDEKSEFQVSLMVDVSFRRTNTDSAAPVIYSDDPSATKVTLTEEDIRDRYPWDYAELTRRLRLRYVDLKTNKKFHDILNPLKRDSRYVHTRLLDTHNPRSSKKDFFSQSVLGMFDQHYIRQ